MKRITSSLLALAVGLFVPTMVQAYDPTLDTGAIAPGAGINGTAHDLPLGQNGLGAYVPNPSDSLNRICIYCHAPHNTWRLDPANGGAPGGSGPQAGAEFTYLPLWNHDLTANAFSYSMYYNGIGAPTVGPKALNAIFDIPLGGTSLLCLSCHDGSVAVNAYGNLSQPVGSQSNLGGTTPAVGAAYTVGLDNNLQNHHPIGFDYDAVASIDTEIRPSDTTDMLLGDPVKNHLTGDGNVKMECSTCHSVHNTGNLGESLLWRSDQNSELCLTCHAKGTYTQPDAAPPAP